MCPAPEMDLTVHQPTDKPISAPASTSGAISAFGVGKTKLLCNSTALCSLRVGQLLNHSLWDMSIIPGFCTTPSGAVPRGSLCVTSQVPSWQMGRQREELQQRQQ